MILIPGLGSSCETWSSTVAHYSGHYQCHVLTLAGFAGQPPQRDFSLEHVVSDLSQYITDRHLGRPVLVGHSLGDTLVLSFAAEHPGQTGSLVIVDAPPALGAVQNPALTSDQLEANAEKMRAGMEAMSDEQSRSLQNAWRRRSSAST